MKLHERAHLVEITPKIGSRSLVQYPSPWHHVSALGIGLKQTLNRIAANDCSEPKAEAELMLQARSYLRRCGFVYGLKI
jgi:hypothetical protein